jgi:hypothetical protein
MGGWELSGPAPAPGPGPCSYRTWNSLHHAPDHERGRLNGAPLLPGSWERPASWVRCVAVLAPLLLWFGLLFIVVGVGCGVCAYVTTWKQDGHGPLWGWWARRRLDFRRLWIRLRTAVRRPPAPQIIDVEGIGSTSFVS